MSKDCKLLLGLFGFSPEQIEALYKAIEWVRKLGERYGLTSEFETEFISQLKEYIRQMLEIFSDMDLTQLGNEFPWTKEGWVSIVIDSAVGPYSADYNSYKELVYLQVERWSWDNLEWIMREIIVNYFDELIGDIDSLEIRDEVERGNSTLVYINGRLCEELSRK